MQPIPLKTIINNPITQPLTVQFPNIDDFTILSPKHSITHMSIEIPKADANTNKIGDLDSHKIYKVGLFGKIKGKYQNWTKQRKTKKGMEYNEREAGILSSPSPPKFFFAESPAPPSLIQADYNYLPSDKDWKNELTGEEISPKRDLFTKTKANTINTMTQNFPNSNNIDGIRDHFSPLITESTSTKVLPPGFQIIDLDKNRQEDSEKIILEANNSQGQESFAMDHFGISPNISVNKQEYQIHRPDTPEFLYMHNEPPINEIKQSKRAGFGETMAFKSMGIFNHQSITSLNPLNIIQPGGEMIHFTYQTTFQSHKMDKNALAFEYIENLQDFNQSPENIFINMPNVTQTHSYMSANRFPDSVPLTVANIPYKSDFILKRGLNFSSPQNEKINISQQVSSLTSNNSNKLSEPIQTNTPNKLIMLNSPEKSISPNIFPSSMSIGMMNPNPQILSNSLNTETNQFLNLEKSAASISFDSPVLKPARSQSIYLFSAVQIPKDILSPKSAGERLLQSPLIKPSPRLVPRRYESIACLTSLKS